MVCGKLWGGCEIVKWVFIILSISTFKCTEGNLTTLNHESSSSLTDNLKANIDSSKSFSNISTSFNGNFIQDDFQVLSDTELKIGNFSKARFINPLNPFNIFGTPKCNDQGFDGMCFELVRCLALDGKVGLLCRGFRGVCCRFIRECGQRTSQEIVYWANYNMRNFYLSSRENRRNFAATSSTCDFRIIKRNSQYCGLRLEPHIHAGFTAPSLTNPGSGSEGDQGNVPECVDARLSILGLGDRLELGLCSARDSLDVKKYEVDIEQVEEVKLAINLARRSDAPVEVKITQIKCNEFTGEDLSGTSTGTTSIVGTESPIPASSVQPPSTTYNPIATTSSPQPSPPAPPVGPVPNFSCGIKGPSARKVITYLDEQVPQYNRTAKKELNLADKKEETPNKPYADTERISYIDKRSLDVEWAVPNNNETIFSYFMGPPLRSLTRVTFGQVTGRREFPWQVAMYSGSGKFSCGGSVIGDFHLLTAGHCVSAYINTPERLTFSLGDWDLTSSSEVPNKVFKASKITIHPQYSSTNLQNDLAVVKVERRIEYSNQIRPICLPTVDDDFQNELATVTGWGKDENGKLVTRLQKVSGDVISNAQCKDRWGRNLIKDTMLCMDSRNGDSCNGDSGGPSVLEYPKGSGKYIQVGIVSFGSGSCTVKDLPGVYTRVSKYRDWIRLQMT